MADEVGAERSFLMPEYDMARILDFCNKEHIRYRHIIHILGNNSEWKKAFGAYYGYKKRVSTTYFFDDLNAPNIFAAQLGKRLRVDGALETKDTEALRAWCADLTCEVAPIFWTGG